MILTKVVLQPTKKLRNAGPHKLELKKPKTKKKSHLKNKKFRSLSTQLGGGSTDPSSDKKNILQEHLFYTTENMKNYPFVDTDASIPIVAW